MRIAANLLHISLLSILPTFAANLLAVKIKITHTTELFDTEQKS
jgi:hypothetical protein